MRKQTALIIVTLVLITLLGSCQAMFTYSPFGSDTFRRDPAKLSDDALKGYASEILSSGDSEAMKEAYDLLAGTIEDPSEDPETALLAADLAIGASGLNDVFTSLVSGFADPDVDPSSFEDSFAALDLDLIADAGDLIAAAATNSNAVVSDTQYATAGAATLLGIQATLADDPDADVSVETQQAVDFLLEVDEIAAILDPEGDGFDIDTESIDLFSLLG